MLSLFREFIHDETGQGIIEYAGVLAFAAGLMYVLLVGKAGIGTYAHSSFFDIYMGPLFDVLFGLARGVGQLAGTW